MRVGVTPIFFGTQSAGQKVIFWGQCQEKRAWEKVKKVSRILVLHFLLSLIPPSFSRSFYPLLTTGHGPHKITSQKILLSVACLSGYSVGLWKNRKGILVSEIIDKGHMSLLLTRKPWNQSLIDRAVQIQWQWLWRRVLFAIHQKFIFLLKMVVSRDLPRRWDQEDSY